MERQSDVGMICRRCDESGCRDEASSEQYVIERGEVILEGGQDKT